MISDSTLLLHIDPYALLNDDDLDVYEDMVDPLTDWFKGKVESCIASIFPDAYMISTNYTPNGQLEILIAGVDSPVSEERLGILRKRLGVDVSEWIPEEIIDGCVLVASPRIKKTDADEQC